MTATEPRPSTGTEVVAHLLARWTAARAALAELERAEHPDTTDHHGRVWTWWEGDLYRHCSLAWTEDMVRNERHSLPSKACRENPNYTLCATCKGEGGDVR
jgi:hypothetical protein